MFNELMARISKELSAKKIPYMIIGGHAVILYGEPRLTRDIDITLGVGPPKLGEILNIVDELLLKPLTQEVDAFVKKTMVLPVIDEKTGIRVDFIFSFTPYEQQAIKRARSQKINNVEVKFASVEDVIIHKIFSHRPRDIEDLKSIFLKNRSIDIDYIKKWLCEFENSFPGEKFAETLEEILKEVGS